MSNYSEAQCVRCGRPTDAAAVDFLGWSVTGSGQAVCPHCQTPSDRRVDGTVAADPEDELLQALDPDNENPEDTR